MTPTRPAVPAVIHGHRTRWPATCATVIGLDQVFPKSLEAAIMIELAAGVSACMPGLPQPPLVPFWRSLVSQTRYTLPALSSAIVGQWATVPSGVAAAFVGVIL